MNLKKIYLIVLLAFLYVGSAFGQAKTLYVNNDIGLDGYNGLSATVQGPGVGPKRTIADAITAAASGDIISVAYVGIEYNENLTGASAVTKNLSFTSTNGTPVINAMTINVAAGVAFTGPFKVKTSVFLQDGPVSGGGNISLNNGATIERTAGSIDAAPVFGTTVNLTYNVAADMTIGPEFPDPVSYDGSDGASIKIVNLTTTGASTLSINKAVQVKGVLTNASKIDLNGNLLTLFSSFDALTTRNHAINNEIKNGKIEVYMRDGGAAGTINLAGVGADIPAVDVKQPSGNNAQTAVINGATTINGAVNVLGDASLQLLTPATIKGAVTNSGTRSLSFVRSAGYIAATVQGNLANNNSGEISVDNNTAAGVFSLTVTGDITNSGALSHTSTAAAPGMKASIRLGNNAAGVTVVVNGNVANSVQLTEAYAGNGSTAANTLNDAGVINFLGITTIDGSVSNSPIIAGANGAASGALTSGMTNSGNIYFGNYAVIIKGSTVNQPNSTFAAAGSGTGPVFNNVGDIVFANNATAVEFRGGLVNSAAGFGGGVGVSNNGGIYFTARTIGTIQVGLASANADLVNNSSATSSTNGNIDFAAAGTGAVTVLGGIRLEGTSGDGDILLGAGAVTASSVTITRTVTNSNITVAASAAAQSFGIVNISGASKLIAQTQTGSIAMNSLTMSAGTLDLGGVSTASITISENVAFTGGSMDLGTGARNMTIQGALANFSGASFSNGTLTTLTFQRAIGGQILTSQSGRSFPGNLVIANTFPVKPTFQLTGGNFTVNGNVTFNAGGAANGVDLTNRNLYVKGNFVNNGGYEANGTPAGYVTMQGGAGQTVGGTASFSNIEVDNTNGVTFTDGLAGAATFTITGAFNLTNGIVNTGAGPDVISLNNSATPPTIVRNAGSFAGTPTFTSNVSVIYIGPNNIPFSNEVPGVSVPGDANKLVDLTIATSGNNTVTATANFSPGGTVTIYGSQKLDIGAFTMTMRGASIVNNGNIITTAGGGSIVLARAAGTAITGAGSLPSIVVNNNSASNSIAGSSGLVNSADPTAIGNGNLTLNGGATSGQLSVNFAGNGPHVNNITTGSGNTLTALSSILAKANVSFGATSVALGANNITFQGNATFTGGMSVSGTGKLVANNTTGASTLTINATPATIGNFEVKTTGQTITMGGGSLVLNGDLTVSGGTLSLGAGLSTTVRGNNVNLTATTSLAGAGILVTNPANGILNINLAGATSIANLTVKDTTALKGESGTLTVTGELKHEGGLLDFAARNINVQTTFTRTGGTYAATTGELQLGSVAGPATVAQGANFSIPNLTIISNANATVAANAVNVTKKFKLDVGAANKFNHKVGGVNRLSLADDATVEIVSGDFDELPGYAGVINFVYSGATKTVSDKVWPATLTAKSLTVNLTAAQLLQFPTGTRTVANTLNLTSGVLDLNTGNRTLNLNDGVLVTRTNASTVDVTGTSGKLNFAGAADLTYQGAALFTSGPELTSIANLRNLTITRTGNVANFVTTIGNAATVNGTLAIRNDVTASAKITALGDITIANDPGSNATAPVVVFTSGLEFGGEANQVLTLNGNRTLGNLTINKANSASKVTLEGGNIIMGAGTLVTFKNGLLETKDNYIKLDNPATSAVQGFVREVATGKVSHVIGNVRKDLKVGTNRAFGRNELPVGDATNYRPVAVSIVDVNATTGYNLGVDIIVKEVSEKPTGNVGLPIGNVRGYPDFYWMIKSTSSLGSLEYDLELTAQGYVPEQAISDIRIIRRSGIATDELNQWTLQGANYDNFLSEGVPVVVNVNTFGGVRPEGAILTYGIGTGTNYSVTGTVKYDNAAATAMNGVTVTLTGTGVSKTATTNAQGQFTILDVPNGTYTIAATKAGWLGANATDALLVAKHYAGTATLADLKLTAADVNASGTVNNTDALLVLKRSTVASTVFAKGDWVSAPGTITVNNANEVADIKALATGDVNGSNTPSLAKAAPTVTVTTENAKLNKTNVINVPVKVATDLNVGAMTLVFSYPADLVSFEGIATKANNVERYDDQKGKIALAWADITGKEAIDLKAGEAIVTLQFKSKQELKAGSVVNVELDGAASEIANKLGEVVNASLNIASMEVAKPTAFALRNNYPNPFNPATTIRYEIPVNGVVNLVVFNSLGEQVATLVNGAQEVGQYEVNFNASNLTSGVYFYRITVNAGEQNFTQTHKMILMK